jgi:primosomal protein N' (replication factor Y)
MYVKVAIMLPVWNTFTYSVPETLIGTDPVGSVVLVPFGSRRVSGIVLEVMEQLNDGVNPHEIKPIDDLLPGPFSLNEEMLEFIQKAADYYFYPIGEALKHCLPPGVTSFTLKSLVITEEGLKNLNNEENSAEINRVLELARLNKSISSIKSLKRSVIMDLLNRGWIEIKSLTKSPRIKPKIERLIRFKEIPQDTVLSEKEENFLNFLKKHIEVSTSTIRRDFPAIYRDLKQLIKKGLVEEVEREVNRIPESELDGDVQEVRELNQFQKDAVEKISESIHSKIHNVYLLYGVTGSGKTEVYLRVIERALEYERGAIYLVPEISLTPQLVLVLRKRFGENVAVMHSAMSDGERFDEWRRTRTGRSKIVIGVRSAIFAPVQNPGVLIVDEEHDPSYKQEEKFRYNARDLAILRARLNNIPVILGSATPSIESYYHAKAGKYILLKLPERVKKREHPVTEVVDMRNEKNTLISERLKEGIIETIKKNEQVILFLNRRGFSPFVLCVECGFRFMCPNCSVSLVYHSYNGTLRCHYCNYAILLPEVCPSCRGVKLRNFGVGTEKVEQEIEKLVPEARILRLDRDTTGSKSSYTRAFMQMKAGEKNILIGTQMVTKGFHFPDVTLVGVILAEQGLQFPDFRASERTFQLLTQVSGRAGRSEKKGRVIIQTFDPEQSAVQNALSQDYELFYNNEIHYREELNYPPFSSLAAIRINGTDNSRVSALSKNISNAILQLIQKHKIETQLKVLGPAPAAIFRLKKLYRWIILLKSEKIEIIHKVMHELFELSILKRERGVILDIDPQSLI